MISPKKNVINASKSNDFLGYAKTELITERIVSEVTYNAGSYGMGGYGFLGLKLEANEVRASEWLVCTLFGAENWINVNGQWLGANQQEDTQRPLHGYNWGVNASGFHVVVGSWDDFTPMVVGQAVSSFECEKHWCQLTIGNAVMQITDDANTRPLFKGTGQPRKLTRHDDLRLAWIMAKDAYLLL